MDQPGIQAEPVMPEGNKHLALRVLLLAILLFGLNAWSVRHIGTDIREFAVANTFLAFVAIVLGWLEEKDANNLRTGFRKILLRVTDGQVILALYLFTLVATSFVSSVSVIADGRNGESTLFLTSEGSERCAECTGKVLQGPNGVVRYVRLTSIFGQPYYLEASGYQRKGFILYPWVGKTISLVNDLVQQPTLVLRIPHSLHNALKGGRLVVEFGDPSNRFEIAMQANQASVMLGPSSTISENLRNEWRSQLQTLGNLPDSLLEKFLHHWNKPITAKGIPNPSPMHRLRIRYLTPSNNEVINQEIVVGVESLQDVLLKRKE